MNVQSQDPRPYGLAPSTDEEDALISKALTVLARRLRQFGPSMGNVNTVRDYLTLHLAEAEKEYFGCLWLTTGHRLIHDDVLFIGTVDGAAVYPREVVKACLKNNAGAVIFYHNHPGGSLEPSKADHAITQKLKQALGMIDVSVLDHIIVAGAETYSFAAHGAL